MHWKKRIYESAYKIADKFRDDPNVVAVALGGSVGRGMTWKHSDLELCLIVEERNRDWQHFNYIEEMGVEVIQLTRIRVEQFVNGFREPGETVLAFPIQVYGCKIVSDPTGLFASFKELYDRSLFHESVTRMKRDEALQLCDTRLQTAKSLAEQGLHKTAAGHLRIGLNYLLLAYYWSRGIFPRSQNRTIHFLKRNSALIGHEKLLDAFLYSFCLNEPVKAMKDRLLSAQPDIFRLAETSWGSNTSTFLQKAVDGNLEWGHDRSIVYVYKYCVHRMQCGSEPDQDVYDNPRFAAEFDRLHRFLDFEKLGTDEVSRMIGMFEDARQAI